MATRAYRLNADYGTLAIYSNESHNSPRDVKGNLRLRSNPHTLTKQFVRYVETDPRYPSYPVPYPSGNPSSGQATSLYNPLYNRARARLISRLRSGSASLGVTLGEYRSTGRMLSPKLRLAAGIVDAVLSGLRRAPKRARGKPEDSWKEKQRLYKRQLLREGRARNGGRKLSARQKAAIVGNAHLELSFGWVPLLSDIHATLTTVCGADIPDGRYSSSATTTHTASTSSSNLSHVSGKVRVTVTAEMSVTNPNLWLLNRLGLTDPLGVAWDLVPWSFVVNKFVNVNQVLSSMSDTYGLTQKNVSRTNSYQLLGEYERFGSGNPRPHTRQNWLLTSRSRTLLAKLPNPTLQFRDPKGSWFDVGIAAALLAQKLGGGR